MRFATPGHREYRHAILLGQRRKRQHLFVLPAIRQEQQQIGFLNAAQIAMHRFRGVQKMRWCTRRGERRRNLRPDQPRLSQA